jgi:hypothetical protein
MATLFNKLTTNTKHGTLCLSGAKGMVFYIAKSEFINGYL